MIRIVGDVEYADGFFDTGFGIGSQIKNGANPFQHLKFQSNDLWIGNLECVISTTSNKINTDAKQFIISPTCLQFIPRLDIYSVANNHVMQHGPDAYKQTLQFLQAENIKYVGSDDKRSICMNHCGAMLGILAFSLRKEKFEEKADYWYQPEYFEIVQEYKKISECDLRIAYIHWGYEFINYPSSGQKKFAHWLIDIGFNLIVGVHPHVLQGYEKYGDGYIFYSLGNFLFNMPSRGTRYSVILNIDYNKELNVSYDYIYINENNCPQIVNSDIIPRQYLFSHLNKLLKINEDDENYFIRVRQSISLYRKDNYKFMIKSLFQYKIEDIVNIIINYFQRKLFYK